jgi:hypothetical protein
MRSWDLGDNQWCRETAYSFFLKKKERKERPSKLLLGFANPALLLFFGQEKER